MTIFASGCSGTYGDDLPAETRESTVWPTLVGNYLNTDTVNSAYSGASNSRIVEQVILHAQNYELVLICWTVMGRFTLEDPSNWIEVNFNQNLSQDFYKKRDYFSTFGKYYYLYWENHMYNFKQWLIQIIQTQRYLKSIDTPYYMICASLNYFNIFNSPENEFIKKLSSIIDITTFSDEQILEKFRIIQKLIKQIDFNNFTAPSTFNIMDDIIEVYPTGNTRHPLEKGNEMIAEHVITQLKNKLAL